MKPYLIALSLLLMSGCRKDVAPQSACAATDPLSVSWVQALTKPLVSCSCTVTLFQGTYKGQTVYFTMMNDPLCDGVFLVKLLDCHGKLVTTFGPDIKGQNDFALEVHTDNTLYSCRQ